MFNAGVLASRSLITRSVTISADQEDWNLLDELFGGTSPGTRALINITIEAGVNLKASSTSVPAMDLTGMPANTEINLTNNGNILGHGGDGGSGQNVIIEGPPIGNICGIGTDGDPGGPAISYDGSGVDLNIDNESGYIFGGGGGGGGGAANKDAAEGGGGGGGGAGGGLGGSGGNALGGGTPGGDGSDGGYSQSSTGGSGGTSSAGAGGPGGNYGAVGSSGGNGTCGSGRAGGAAGKAVANGGDGTTTFTTGGVDGTDVKGAVE